MPSSWRGCDETAMDHLWRSDHHRYRGSILHLRMDPQKVLAMTIKELLAHGVTQIVAILLAALALLALWAWLIT